MTDGPTWTEGSTEGKDRTRLGVKLATHFHSVEEILALAVQAEDRGFDSVWTTEGRMSPDAVTMSAAIATLTQRVRIGTSVVNPFSRTPGLIAISAASIDRISHGRFILGIGAGDPPTLQKQNIPYDRPLARVNECVAVIRALWSGRRVDYQGEVVRVSDLEMDFLPYQEMIPIYVAATGPRALRQANRIGDGILLNVCVAKSSVDKVIASADRGRGVKVIGNVVVGMDRDAETAMRRVKPFIVTYLTRFPAIARASGLPDDTIQAVTQAARDSVEAACALLPDDCVRELAAVGSPDDCRRWISEYVAGMDEALLTPILGNTQEVLDELAELLPHPAHDRRQSV